MGGVVGYVLGDKGIGGSRRGEEGACWGEVLNVGWGLLFEAQGSRAWVRYASAYQLATSGGSPERVSSFSMICDLPVEPYFSFIPIIHVSYLACIFLFLMSSSRSPDSNRQRPFHTFLPIPFRPFLCLLSAIDAMETIA